jgi:hypothetical protein
MLAVLTALVLTSPLEVKCTLGCWPTDPPRCYYEMRLECTTPCEAPAICTPRLVNLGVWEPRPAPIEWIQVSPTTFTPPPFNGP